MPRRSAAYVRKNLARMPGVFARAVLAIGDFEGSIVYPDQRKTPRFSEVDKRTPDIYLVVPDQYSDGFIRLNLTGFTVPELDAARMVVDKAFDLARPIAEERDAGAVKEAEANPDLFLSRVSRAIPRLLVKPGFEQEHGSQLPARPEHLPEVPAGTPEG
ncbi:MAG: hypothetical protein EOO77_41440 [Oxalobacteraceae bacterium]|nr:MAG: hypothetical protein EOO77_41440 [Oxalobacteraceae bacterium]